MIVPHCSNVTLLFSTDGCFMSPTNQGPVLQMKVSRRLRCFMLFVVLTLIRSIIHPEYILYYCYLQVQAGTHTLCVYTTLLCSQVLPLCFQPLKPPQRSQRHQRYCGHVSRGNWTPRCAAKPTLTHRVN